MTWHEKIGLMYTNYTTSHYYTYLTFCDSYIGFVNNTWFAALISKVSWSWMCYVKSQSYETSKSKKIIKFFVHISPIFSCRVKYIIIILLYICIIDIYL